MIYTIIFNIIRHHGHGRPTENAAHSHIEQSDIEEYQQTQTNRTERQIKVTKDAA